MPDQALPPLVHLKGLAAAIDRLRPRVARHVTPDRVGRYLQAICDTPALSNAASVFRLPVLKSLLDADGAFAGTRLHLVPDFEQTGSMVMLTGSKEPVKPLWFFAHLDTISYLVLPRDGDGYPLVPFCYHLLEDGGACPAKVYRYDLDRNGYRVIAEGRLVSGNGRAVFRPARAEGPGVPIGAGDRVVPLTPFRLDATTGTVFGHVDNAGAVAALAVAAPVLAEAGLEALLAFPDEEEGPQGSGNQVIGRGGSRIVSLLPAPDLAIVADVQQAGGETDADVRDGVENSIRMGKGAVLAEFASLARGAVTPPDLYALAKQFNHMLRDADVNVQESNNAYTSRSDDVSVLLKTPNILLLGFPGFNRHFDHGEPRANLRDVVNLAKALIYYSALAPIHRTMREERWAKRA